MNDLRKPFVIKKELSELQKLIHENEILISKYPDKFSLKLGFKSLKDREDSILLELKESITRYQLDAFEFVLDGDVVDDYKISLSFFGNIMTSLQDITTSISQSINGTSTVSGTISRDIVDASRLDLVATATGSFKVILSSHEPQVSESFAKAALKRFNCLVKSEDDKDSIKEGSKELGKRVINKYKTFLEIIFKNNATILIQDEIFSETGGIKEIDGTLAKKIHDVIVEVEEYPVESVVLSGVLKGISLIYYTFEFLPDDSDAVIKGKFDPSLESEVKTYLDVPSVIKFDISTSIKEITDEEKKEWKLIYFEE